MAGIKLDRTDKRILDILQRDASTPMVAISESVGASKSACWRRIQRLEEEGVIRGRVTLLEPARVGLPLTVYIAIRTSQHNDKWVGDFKTVTSEIDEIIEVHRMSGDLDYLLKAVVSDMAGYDRLYKRLIKADFFDVSSSFVMEEMKSTTVLPLDSD
ncbi:MAG: Lrp/AsnC family transcriptional regulator [Pseudomonadota bacterium]